MKITVQFRVCDDDGNCSWIPSSSFVEAAIDAVNQVSSA